MTMRNEACPIDESTVPICLDITIAGLRLKEEFMWNLYESQEQMEAFAEQLAHDQFLPSETFVPAILQGMEEQLMPFRATMLTGGASDAIDTRIKIKLDIHIDNTSLMDEFEWDVESLRNKAVVEEFARILSTDLGLDDRFRERIEQSVDEQIAKFEAEHSLPPTHDVWSEAATLQEVPSGHLDHMEHLDMWTPEMSTFLDDATQAGSPDKLSPPRITVPDRDASYRRQLAHHSGGYTPIHRVHEEEHVNRRRTSAYAIFSTEQRQQLSRLPQYDGMHTNEMAQLIGKMWREMPFNERAPYQMRADKANNAHSVYRAHEIPRLKISTNSGGDSSHEPPRKKRKVYVDRKTNCINCGCPSSETSTMRRGPDGTASLCNACGLSWKRWGTLTPRASSSRQSPASSVPTTPKTDLVPNGFPDVGAAAAALLDSPNGVSSLALDRDQTVSPGPNGSALRVNTRGYPGSKPKSPLKRLHSQMDSDAVQVHFLGPPTPTGRSPVTGFLG